MGGGWRGVCGDWGVGSGGDWEEDCAWWVRIRALGELASGGWWVDEG